MELIAEREARPAGLVQPPNLYLIRMGIFLVGVLAVAAWLSPQLKEAFAANLAINGIITAVLLLGVAYTLGRVVRLGGEARWVNNRAADEPGTGGERAGMLAPLNALFRERGSKTHLSAPAMRAVMDSIGARLDESREITRYLVGLLIFLGLLGTFWGLLGTIQSVGETINSIQVGGGAAEEVFASLRAGLEGPLDGMGTAFSSSLFGLSGSLVLGFLDLQAGQAQNRFYNDLEEWLASLTRITHTGGPMSGGEGGTSVPAYITALIEQTADNLETLERTLSRTAEDRARSEARLAELSERLAGLMDIMRQEQRLLIKLGEGQKGTDDLLKRVTDALDDVSEAAPRTQTHHLESILREMVTEAERSRQEVIQGMRQEIKLMARTLAAAMAKPDQSGTPPHSEPL